MKRLLRNVFSLVVLTIMILAIIEVFKLDVLPNKYLYLFIGGEIVLFILGCILYNLKNKLLIVLGIILYLISILGNIFGYYYLSKTNKYIHTSLKKEYYTEKTTYYLITSKNNSVNKIDDLNKDTTITYYKYSKSIDKALKILGDYKYKDTDTASWITSEIKNNNDGYLLLAKANYEYLFASTNIESNYKDEFKIIYEFEVEDKVLVNKNMKDSYNIYINGLDFTGVMRDYNLIVTINTKTKKIVLTSIPRDYYINVPAYNMKDTLMCLGSLDSEVSKEALEDLFNTKIDYSINLNTTSLVNVVDSVGGVTFCSDYDFYTTHPMVLDTYNDTGRKLHVTKGCREYNGIETLAIARERNAFPGRDRYRQKNCRQILLNITKKLASTTTLTNYTEVLSSFDGLYTTNMNDKVIKHLIKTYIDDPNFEIIEQSVDGTDGLGIGHLGAQESWIMEPDMNTVNEASKKINEVINEK